MALDTRAICGGTYQMGSRAVRLRTTHDELREHNCEIVNTKNSSPCYVLRLCGRSVEFVLIERATAAKQRCALVDIAPAANGSRSRPRAAVRRTVSVLSRSRCSFLLAVLAFTLLEELHNKVGQISIFCCDDSTNKPP